MMIPVRGSRKNKPDSKSAEEEITCFWKEEYKTKNLQINDDIFDMDWSILPTAYVRSIAT